jgi:ribosomal protein L3 glutamine methyltransferase
MHKVNCPYTIYKVDLLNMLKTLEDYLNWASNEFTKAKLYFGHGTDNPWDEAVHIAIYVLNLPKDNPRSVLKIKLSQKEGALFEQIAKERINTKKPLPYILGYCWYAHEKYLVNENTIVPRSPIFELLLDHLKPWLATEPASILDMCTGSGCLAIVAGKQFKTAKVIGVDISTAALEVAQKNIELHKTPNVSLLQSDLFTNLQDFQFDTIISNPPYVSDQEMHTLPAEYLHEPGLALESADNGLALSKQIMLESAKHLKDGGILVLEVGNSYYELEKLDKKIEQYAVYMLSGGHGIYVFPKEDLRAINARISKRI